MTLTFAELDEIRERVSRKGWLNLIHHPEDGKLVDRIVSCSSVLNPEQRTLFGKLIDAYLYIPEVRQDIYDLWTKIRATCDLYQRVYLAPLKKRAEKRTKSGDHICYVLSSLFPQHDQKFRFLGTPFSDEIINLPEHCIVLVDDFVGTGETLEECYEQFSLKHPGMTAVVATIVAQEQGITAAARIGVEILTNHRRSRTISDGIAIAGEPAENLRIYSSIEGSVGVAHEYRLGYGASEATVTISRTPDNTLPIFWTNANQEEFKWSAPFPRR
ncbi:MAG: hypothetical protein EOP06_07190 [Proteobacteria bacterium]|nr:MAG: hypothetical protein EOP06_07190 [Pseudomonadota bacterium]